MPHIQYKDPESEEIVSIDIGPGMPVVTIGRNPGNVIRVNNPSISRQHAKIVWEQDACTLIDLDSSNGSYVNGQQIKSQLLQPNDRLRVGEFALDFLLAVSDPIEHDVVSMSHEDIDIGDILSSADVDDALFDEKPGIGNISEISSQPAVNESPPSESPLSESPQSEIPPALNDSLFLDSDDESNEIVVVDNDPGFVSDPELTGANDLTDFEDLRPNSGASPPAPVFESISDPLSAQVDSTEFELRIVELTTERDELLDVLQSRAGDAGGAAKVQIDRLRAERDRLIEERRNLQRSQRDLRTQLEAFPPIEEMAAFNEELHSLRSKDENHETRMGGLHDEIQTHLETIESLTSTGLEQLNTIEQLENRVSANDDLSQELERVKGEVQNFDVVKSQLEDQVSQLLNDGASSVERDQNHASRIEHLEKELNQKTDTVQDLESDKQELMKRSLELDELREEYKSIQLELQARPIAEEVQTIIADLASARATIENNDQIIDELETNKSELNQLLETANEAQGQFDSRFDKQSEELNEVRRTYQALKKEKEAFARETDYLLSAKRNYDSDIRSAQKKVQELEKNDRRKKKIFDELRSDLEVLIGENTILQTGLDSLGKQLDSAPTDDDLQASISLSKERIEEIAGLKLTISDLEDELESQTKVAKTELDKFEIAHSKLTESEIELEALRMVVSDELNSSDENIKLSKTIEEHSKKIKSLTKDLNSVSSKNDKKEDEVGKLKSDNKALKKELVALTKKTTNKEKEAQSNIEKLEKQIADAENALAEIILEKDKLEDEIAATN